MKRLIGILILFLVGCGGWDPNRAGARGKADDDVVVTATVLRAMAHNVFLMQYGAD